MTNKLLFVLSEYLPESGGGIISYYAGILPSLVKAGYSVDVLVASGEFLDRGSHIIDGVQISYLKREFLEKARVGFSRFDTSFPTFAAFMPLAWAAYEQVQHGAGYDLVETTDFPLLFAPWVVSQNSPPAIVALHGSCGQLDWYGTSRKNSLDGDYLRLVESKAFASAPGVYTNSEGNSKFWNSETHREIPVLPPHAVEEMEIHTDDFECSDDGVVIGRFQNWKGSEVLCQALTQLPRKQVHWFGSDVVDNSTGKTHSDLLNQKFPNIIGSQLILEKPLPRKEILRKIVSAAFLCVPSEWDVFNLSVIEAMSLGTPVVCSKNAGASMLIQHGKNGYLFDPEKPEELVQAIQAIDSLSKTQRNKLTEHALETLRDCLNSNRLISLRLAYYQSIKSSSRDWKRDEWLYQVLSPRNESNGRIERLNSYTALELFQSSIIKACHGILCRIGVSKGK